jgi:hypothetical protein
MLRSPYVGDVATLPLNPMADDDIRHTPKPLGEPPRPDVAALVEAARRERLVLYLGAGVSIPPPASGPRGNEIADLVRPIVAELLGIAVDSLPERELESLAARVESHEPELLGQLKERVADAWPFIDMEPNYGHEAIALLVREGLVRAVSANWDCGVENGGRQVQVSIEGVSRAIDVLGMPVGALPLYKVHGCARRPQTIVLTRTEVDQPERWARAAVESALTGGVVVFVGLGTVGSYVGEPVEELVELWIGDTTTVRVVDPFGLSEPWRQVLGERAEQAELVMGADEFFDDLLRAVVREALSRVGELARALHVSEGQDWSEATVSGHGALAAAFAESPADAVLRWWRGGVTSGVDGRPFVFDRSGQVALMCVCQLTAADGGGLAASGVEGDLTLRTAYRYFEIACRPQEHWRKVEKAARARVDRRRRAGRYAAGVPITVAIEGATGAFPDPSAPADIAAGATADSDIAAGDRDALRIVRAEDVLSGRLAA